MCKLCKYLDGANAWVSARGRMIDDSRLARWLPPKSDRDTHLLMRATQSYFETRGVHRRVTHSLVITTIVAANERPI